MEDEIVARLRADSKNHLHWQIVEEAADEIERLRAERDEARREIVESLHPDLRDSYVAARGWDCFKETDNG